MSFEKIEIFLTEAVCCSSYCFEVNKDSLDPVIILAYFLAKWTLFCLTKLSCNTPHRRSTTVSLATCPLCLFSWGIFGHLMYLDQSRASENI